jgi:hypothetical protein
MASSYVVNHVYSNLWLDARQHLLSYHTYHVKVIQCEDYKAVETYK